MIIWRFKYARGPQFGGTQHAFSHSEIFFTGYEKSLCGRSRVSETVGDVPGYKTLPGQRCKTCARMAETQQEFQPDPRVR